MRSSSSTAGPPGTRGSGRSSSLEWCVTTAASVTAHVGGRGVCRAPPHRGRRALTPARTTTSRSSAGLDTLARVTPGPDDGLRAVLHAASALTSQGGLVVYVGGPLADDDARTLAALRQPGSAGAAMVVDPSAFAGRVACRPGRRVVPRDHAAATTATLQSSGWTATVVDARTGPAAAWSAVVGSQVVGDPMSRARPVETLLAALAVLGVSLPLMTLFAPMSAWFRPTVLLVALVALVGMGLRSLTSSPRARRRRPGRAARPRRRRSSTARATCGPRSCRSPRPVPRSASCCTEAYETVTNYTAPAPSNRGTVLAVSLLIGITAVAVDAIGVTYRSPALAGVPLLVRVPRVGDELR